MCLPLGLHRVSSIDCDLDEVWFWDHDKWSSPNLDNDDRLMFDVKHKGTTFATDDYRSRWGGFVDTSVVYTNNDHNFEVAIRRQFAIRFGDSPGLHYQLIENQRAYLFPPSVTALIRDRVTSLFSDFDFESRFYSYAHMPHVKRKMRIAAYKKIIGDGGSSFSTAWSRALTRVRWTIKIKRFERAKFRKRPRTVIDLGPEASLVGGYVVELLKDAFSSFDELGGRFDFVGSPDPNALVHVLEHLIDPEGVFYFPYFSDDSCLAYRCLDGIFRCNLDISSCDASVGTGVADILLEITSGVPLLHQTMSVLLDQCRISLKARSLSGQKLSFRAHSFTEYSGCVLTTLLNNVANLFIMTSISGFVGTRQQLSIEIPRAAARLASKFLVL